MKERNEKEKEKKNNIGINQVKFGCAPSVSILFYDVFISQAMRMRGIDWKGY